MTRISNLCSLIKCSNCCLFSFYDAEKVTDWIQKEEDSKVREYLGHGIYERIKNMERDEMLNYFKSEKKDTSGNCYFKKENHCLIHPSRIGEEIRPEGSADYLCKPAEVYNNSEEARNNLNNNLEFLKDLLGEAVYSFNGYKLLNTSIFIKHFMNEEVDKRLYKENQEFINSSLVEFEKIYEKNAEEAMRINKELEELLIE